MSRPSVTVYSGTDGKPTCQVQLAAVFESPIRLDVVHHVHRDMQKNKRQPYAVSRWAGHQTSAESWGTGRAVARIPRVPGGGTHRAGQGAYGNMCRGGRMFGPTKTYRRWHRRINKNQRRFALVSALAASASTSLVFARGHRIDRIPEVPLVVDEKTVAQISKTKNAVAFLKKIHAYADVEKVIASKTLRAGRGKMRNRRYVKRRGPLIIYNDKTIPLLRALRNIPGVEFVSVHRLNLLKLAPGGHLGRFVIWTRDAFVQLDKLYGTYKRPSKLKHGYSLPRSALTNSDLGRLINSAEVQSHLHRKKKVKKYVVHKKNALTNLGYLIKLNPYAKVQRRQSILATLNAGKRRRTAKAEHEKLKAARKQKKEKRDAEAKTKTGTKTQAKRLSHRKLFVKTLLS